jgi:methionine synthase II (cobalamin-independent)
MTTVTGMGSWPGSDVGEALRTVRDLLGDLEGDVSGLPYLPELPARGPGADLVGRGAGLLVDLPVDLQPAGWRLVERPGRDAGRTRALWREDLDQLAEAFDGYAGPLKVQVAGPWTLAASVWLTRGERAVVDAGATRDLAASLAEGVSRLVADVGRLVPAADLVVQVDEPLLPAVLEGRLPTASGFGRLPAVERQSVLAGLQQVLAAAGARDTLVHCCAAHAPLPTLRASGARGIAVDTSLLTPRGWEGVAVAVEEGLTLYAGCVPAGGADGSPPPTIASGLADWWQRLGLPAEALARVVVSPACGLAGLSREDAIRQQRTCLEAARFVADRSAA